MNGKNGWSIATYWVFGTHGRVEVDDTGNIQVSVRTTSEDGPNGRAGKDGFARSDVTNVAALQELLGKARAFAAAVFPPAGPGRADLEFTWQERADAYRLLDFHRKLPDFHKPENNATVVTDFLRDWKREQGALGRAGIPDEMDDFARRWERWW